MIREHTITIQQAKIYGLVLFLPIIVLTGLPFFLLNGFQLPGPSFINTVFFILLMLGGVVVHELLHGVVWVLGHKEGWKAVKMGFTQIEPE